MIGVLRPYSEYQDSGVSWLGPIPDHWERVHGGAVLQQKKMRNRGMVEDTVLSLSHGRIVIKPPEKLHGLVPESFETYQIVDPGDIIVRPTDLQNDWTTIRVAIARDRGIITSAYLCFHARKPLTPEYTHLLLLGYDMKKVFYGMGSGLRQNLDWSDFKRLPMLVPPAEEQHAIVRYVAWLDRRVRRFIRNRRRLIEVLNEQKQAIITRAVTQGIDPNAPLKASGVDWLGNIPAHWKALPLKYVSKRILNGVTPPTNIGRYYDQGTIPWYGPSSIKKSKSVSNPVKLLAAEAFIEGKARLIRAPAILIVVIGATVGRMGLLKEDGATNQQITAFELRNDMVRPAFAVEVLSLAENHLKATASTATIPILDSGEVARLPVLSTKLEEQDLILQWIENNTVELISTITRTKREIDLIHEYRTRLISDVVTGKIDVRHLAPPPGSEDLEDMAEALEPLEDVMADVEIDDEEAVNESD